VTTRQLKIPFGPLRNSNLFSNHWLEHRLTLEPEWTEYRPLAVRLLGQLAELWRQQKNRVDQYTEPTLEEAFIQPVFKELGWMLLYQQFLRGRKPDYALFLSEQDLDSALSEGRKSPAFWAHAAIVADAKAWTVNLDRPTIINNQREYPPEQIERYIHYSLKDYGILTNGRLWRLYPHNLSAHQPRFNTYFECDLAKVLERWIATATDKGQRTFAEDNDIIEDFLTFCLFFSPLAFTTIQTRKPLIYRAIEGSNEYRLGIGEGLKDRVFEALRICMEGFLSHEPNNLNPQADLCRCKGQSLVLLYRLLFIMYAEDRELLPFRSNRLYRENRSLGRFRDQVSEKLDRIEQGNEQDYDRTTQDLWDALSSLFDLIDRGGKQYGVPAYNGGLFDPEENSFLKDKVLPDWYLARVLDQLGRATDAEHPDAGLFRVDYRDLSIQHLGHVYEGLLELQPHWAKEPMVIVRKINHHKSYEQVIPDSQRIPKGYEYTGIRYETGKVFLVPDKGERRSTGSYYTPNYIVDYIVSQTLGPLCKEISDKLEQDIKQTESERKNARGRNRQLLNDRLQKLQSDFDNRVLRLKVLDPAMGSGHFLLRACQYLAEEIATNPNTSNPEADQLLVDESLLTFWKRRVVEHCLYGVDINPLAVELAKVALWLETAAIGQPLAFLDHHLRCGNSLVGGWVADLGALTGVEPLPLFEQQASSILPGVIEGFKAIAGKPSDTRDDVKVKAQIYNQAIDRVRKPFVTVADLWCATFFLDEVNQIKPDQYQQALQTLSTPTKYRTLLKSNWFKNAINKARQPDVACFHWELEFPDVFFDLTGRRPEAGFDVIIGNPPWGGDIDKELDYFHHTYPDAVQKTTDSFKLFISQSCRLVSPNGYISMIVPQPLLRQNRYKDVRALLIRLTINSLVDLGENVFPKVVAPACIFVVRNSSPSFDHSVELVDSRDVPENTRKSVYLAGGAPTTNRVKQQTFFNTADLAFVPEMMLLISKIFSKLSGVSELRCRDAGINYQRVGVGMSVKGNSDLGERLLYEGAREKTSHVMFWKGSDFGRYWISERTHRFCRPEVKEKLRPNEVVRLSTEIYKQVPKILLRQTADRILACIDYAGIWFGRSVLCITLERPQKHRLEYFLGLLNSKYFVHLYRQLTGEKGRVFAQVKFAKLKQLPIRTIDFDNPDEKIMHDKIVQLVERMLDLYKKFSAAKIMDEKTQIQSQIFATDSQIDQLVYQLYGLTPEEIKIVEESTT
jgi:hypothetical protein